MQISARVDYAMRALVVMATDPDSRMTCESLANAQSIPPRFLEGILTALRRAGIVASHRGVDGGYQLAKKPAEVTVAAVIRALDGPLAAVRGMRPEQSTYLGPVAPLQQVWVAARASLRAVLEHVTVADIATDTLPGQVTTLSQTPDSWVSH